MSAVAIVSPETGPGAVVHPAREWSSQAERDAWTWFLDHPDQRPTDETQQLSWLLLRWRVDPILYAIECLRIMLLPYQAEVLLNLADAPREVFEFYGFDAARAKRQILVSSGHGIGKTRTESVAILWHKDTHQFSKTLVTAPTADQITGQLWGEIGKLHRRQRRRWPIIANEWDLLGSSINHKNTEFADWYVIGRTARADSPEGLQGAHGQDADDEFGELAQLFSEEIEVAASGGMLVVVEEASGVESEVRQVLEGALSELGARLLAVGNSTRPDGWFAEDQDKPQRYGVFQIDSRTSNATTVFSLPYRDLGGTVRQLHIRGRVSEKYWLDLLADCDGDEDHDRFRVRVRGMKPRSAFEQIIRTHWVEQAQARQPDEASRKAELVIGLDFGLTGDKHAKAVRQAHNWLDLVEWLPKEKPEEITLDAVDRTKEDVEMYRSSGYAGRITIVGDANGVGRGAMETLWRFYQQEHPEKNVRVIFFNSGAKALDDTRYYLRRDEMWHKRGRAWFASPRAYMPRFVGITKQLTGPGAHEDERRKIWVESKADVKKRTGEESGNGADAFLHTLVFDDEPVQEKAEEKPKDFFSPAFRKAINRLDRIKELQNGVYIR